MKSATFALAFGKHASFRRAGRPRRGKRKRQREGPSAAPRRKKAKKSCRKIWSVKKNRLPLQSFSASRKASAAEAPPSGTGIPEDIEKAYNRQRQESTRAKKIEPARKSRSQFLNRPRGHAAE